VSGLLSSSRDAGSLTQPNRGLKDIMRFSRWIKVDARIVECFRAWGEAPGSVNPLYEIVVDIKTPAGTTERVSTLQQRLISHTHRWRPPDPGELVRVKWDPPRRALRLDLGGDPRYDEKLIRALGRTRDVPAGESGLGAWW
jgi:hypothetical protein